MEIAFTIVYHPVVVREDIPELDSVWSARIKISIEQKLGTAPETFGIPLRRSLRGYRKLRVGDYRIIFRIEKKIVMVIAIMHRSVIYQQITKRVQK